MQVGIRCERDGAGRADWPAPHIPAIHKLFVIDGAKALRKAITDNLRPARARCRQHKKRNVTDALPERMHSSVRSAMSQAYASGEPKRARQLLENLARSLERGHPGAAASLREGLEETLTVMRLELPESLERVLSSTNLIENLFSRVRHRARRVRHWQGGAMIMRWTAAAVLEAERNFPQGRRLSRPLQTRGRAARSRCRT